jgi:hypothetical protein
MVNNETLDIEVRFVIPRQLLKELEVTASDDQIVQTSIENLKSQYEEQGIQVHLASVSNGLIVEMN